MRPRNDSCRPSANCSTAGRVAVEPEAQLDGQRTQLAGPAQTKVDLDEALEIGQDLATGDAPQDRPAR